MIWCGGPYAGQMHFGYRFRALYSAGQTRHTSSVREYVLWAHYLRSLNACVKRSPLNDIVDWSEKLCLSYVCFHNFGTVRSANAGSNAFTATTAAAAAELHRE